MKTKFNADRIVSVSAILVSTATLLMIFYQTNLMRIEQRASVMPSLRIGISIDQDTLDVVQERIFISNDGLGPAFIENIVIIDSTGRHETDLYGYFEAVNSNKSSSGIYRFYAGLIIPKNDTKIIYKKYTDQGSNVILYKYFEYPLDLQINTQENTNKAVIEIHYKSVYDEHWKVRSDSPIPIKLD
jgi:hypothetical protein